MYVGQLVAAYRARGVNVVVALDQRLDPTVFDRLLDLGASVRRADLSGPGRDDGTTARFYGALVEETSPDLVHLVRGSHRSGLPLAVALASRPVRLVVTEQYIPDDAHLDLDLRARVDSLYRSAAAVVFVSQANLSTMAAALGKGPTPWAVIPNGVDVTAIGRRTIDPRLRLERLRRRPVRLVAASRFTAQKGLDLLIEALAQLPGGTATAAIFGEGPDAEALRRQADEAVTGTVSFHPWCADVVGAFADADLFILPSRNEGMPFTLLEAMAAGIPVVAADAPGVAEALDSGGRIVPRNDHAELARAVLDAIADPAETAARAEMALRRVRDHHDVRSTMRATVNLAFGEDGGITSRRG